MQPGDGRRAVLQDLATLVNDQSGMVDDISDHIERTADRTRDANVQLRKVRSIWFPTQHPLAGHSMTNRWWHPSWLHNPADVTPACGGVSWAGFSSSGL